MRKFIGLVALTASLYLGAEGCQIRTAANLRPGLIDHKFGEKASSGELEEKRVQDLDSIIEATYRLKGEVLLKETLTTVDGNPVGERFQTLVSYCSTFNFAKDGKKSYRAAFRTF